MSAHDSPIVCGWPAPDLVLVRDARGSLVHVRQRGTNECRGHVEAGLFEMLRALIFAEAAETETVPSRPQRISDDGVDFGRTQSDVSRHQSKGGWR